MARPLADHEKELLSLMLGSNYSKAIDTECLLVEDLNDGGMGSIRFIPMDKTRRAMPVAAAEFKDADGVIISVQIYMDQHNRLYELDIWKTDFTPIIQYPQVSNAPKPKSRDFH